MQAGQLDLQFEGYYSYFNYAERKGYSGTAIYTKHEPLNVTYGIGIEEHDTEGRVITLEYDKFFFITVYTPNSGSELKRLEYRMSWEEDFKNYLLELNKTKGVVVCGDLNVAHKEIDVKNDKANRGQAGFTDEERREFNNLLDLKYIDTFRKFYPEEERFTWWSYFGKAREKNVGWRIDYFIISNELDNNLKDAMIYDNILRK
jgi:exodeoxyribonuclease III